MFVFKFPSVTSSRLQICLGKRFFWPIGILFAFAGRKKTPQEDVVWVYENERLLIGKEGYAVRTLRVWLHFLDWLKYHLSLPTKMRRVSLLRVKGAWPPTTASRDPDIIKSVVGLDGSQDILERLLDIASFHQDVLCGTNRAANPLTLEPVHSEIVLRAKLLIAEPDVEWECTACGIFVVWQTLTTIPSA